MRLVRTLLSVFLVALFVVDAIIAVRLATYGWPRVLRIETVDGVTYAESHVLPMSASDWMVLGVYLIVHVVVCYFTWRAWSQWRHGRTTMGR
jgi:hypothetical protein